MTPKALISIKGGVSKPYKGTKGRINITDLMKLLRTKMAV